MWLQSGSLVFMAADFEVPSTELGEGVEDGDEILSSSTMPSNLNLLLTMESWMMVVEFSRMLSCNVAAQMSGRL